MARKHMLVTALNTLFEIGINADNRPADRVTALKEVIHFASEAQGGGSKQVNKLSPQAARLIARLGVHDNGQDTPARKSVPEDLSYKERSSSEFESEGEISETTE